MPLPFCELLLGQLVKATANNRLYTAYELAQEYKNSFI
jgi:hypothetical protein